MARSGRIGEIQLVQGALSVDSEHSGESLVVRPTLLDGERSRSFEAVGSSERADEVEPDPDEGSPADADPHTFEKLATSSPAAFSNAVVRYYVTDHLGSPRVVLDAQRQVLDRHDYEPFGVELAPFADQSDLTHRFTGHERDLQTGYDYMHYRFYGSTLARFLKPDNIPGTLTDPQSWNLYAYVRNNPANATDPTGHLSDLFLREIAASPSSDQGIGATRTADGTPPPAGQKEAEDLNKKTPPLKPLATPRRSNRQSRHCQL